MRTAAKKDANHNEVKAELERLGFQCHDVHQLKKFCDTVAHHKLTGICVMVEIKDGKGKLTKGEQTFFDAWEGHKAVVRNIEDCKLLDLACRAMGSVSEFGRVEFGF